MIAVAIQRRRVGAALAMTSLIAGIGLSASLPARQAIAKPASRSGTTHRVTIEGLRFEPAVLTVKRGDRIVWMNQDPIPHTATAASKAFDSGSIPANGSWSYRAVTAGEYEYGCNFHPTMKGKLIVR